jgi:hypothetical protein
MNTRWQVQVWNHISKDWRPSVSYTRFSTALQYEVTLIERGVKCRVVEVSL